MSYVDTEALFRPRLGEPTDVDIPGVGTVRVRGLSRAEAMHVQAADDLAEKDRRIIAQGMVEPSLVVAGLKHRSDPKPCEACADAGRWQRASLADEMEQVAEVITRLSGLAPDADKEAYKSLPGESGDRVRVLPGRPAEDVGGGATAADVG